MDPAAVIPVDINESITMITFWGMRLLSALFILALGWMGGNYARRGIDKLTKLDATLRTFLGGLAKYAIFTISIITILGQFGVQTASLIAVVGAAGLAIGLALQGTLTNVASGVMLLILRPFNVGEYIQAGKVEGTVKSLGLFATELANAENVYIFVPNSQIWNSDIVNYNRNPMRRLDLLVPITHADDIEEAFAAIQGILDNEKRLIRTDGKEPQIMVSGISDASVNLTVRLWAKTAEFWQVKWDLLKEIKAGLTHSGIAMPARTLYMLPPEGGKEIKMAESKPGKVA